MTTLFEIEAPATSKQVSYIEDLVKTHDLSDLLYEQRTFLMTTDFVNVTKAEASRIIRVLLALPKLNVCKACGKPLS